MTPDEALARMAAFHDLSVPDDQPDGWNEAEWSATAAVSAARVEEAAKVTVEGLAAHIAAVNSGDPAAPALEAMLDRLTRVVAVTEVTRATDRVWVALSRDEQTRCVEKAARELGKLPTILTAKMWLAAQIEANAREGIRSIGGGDWRLAIAKSGSPALAWLSSYRLVADVMSTPGQGAKTLGLVRRWPFR